MKVPSSLGFLGRFKEKTCVNCLAASQHLINVKTVVLLFYYLLENDGN